MALPAVKLTRGIHVLHLFFQIDRLGWAQMPSGSSARIRSELETFCAANSAASFPRVLTYANISGKADLAFLFFASELGQIGQMHRDLENCFAPGTLIRGFTFLSVTELPEYVTTEEDM